jgi:16S rRNA (adenine(1408)-N(1))-methyltransferase
VAIDLGAGDGRHVLTTARARPDTLVIGVDANADGMAEASRRAARRDAVPNALFAVAAAEHPP